jgi:hypothetical protein
MPLGTCPASFVQSSLLGLYDPHGEFSQELPGYTLRQSGTHLMGKLVMKYLRDNAILVSAAELGEVIGTDLETVKNWIRREIITRAPIGGRQLRNRLFSTDEVYKTAMLKQLVDLGIGPSAAHEAVNVLWKAWGKKEAPEGWNVYAVLWPRNDNWIVALCSQKISGGPFYKFWKAKSTEEMELPRQAFAVIPISDVFERVNSKLSELMGDLKNHGANGKP